MDTWSKKVHKYTKLCPRLESREIMVQFNSLIYVWPWTSPVLPGSLREMEREEGEEGQLSLHLTNPDHSHHFLTTWSSGKNTGVGGHALFHGIFLTQESNLGLLHYRQILYHLSH